MRPLPAPGIGDACPAATAPGNIAMASGFEAFVKDGDSSMNATRLMPCALAPGVGGAAAAVADPVRWEGEASGVAAAALRSPLEP